MVWVVQSGATVMLQGFLRTLISWVNEVDIPVNLNAWTWACLAADKPPSVSIDVVGDAIVELLQGFAAPAVLIIGMPPLPCGS